MASLNSCSFIGRTGKEVEVKTFGSGEKVVTVSLAVSNSYKNKSGEKVEETEWINLEFWGGVAGIAEQYITKGSQIYVEGRYKTDQWEKDGVKQSRVKIRVSNLVLLGGSKNSEESAKPHSSMGSVSNSQHSSPEDSEDDDLPF